MSEQKEDLTGEVKVVEVKVVDADEKAKKLVLSGMERDRATLLIRMPFIGGIMMQLSLMAIDDFRCQTACTDYKTIFINTDFYKALSEEERLFVMAHEAWHVVLYHIGRRQNRDNENWNVAADLEIHFVLEDDMRRCGMREPWVLPHDESWKGKSAEEIYELIKKSKEEEQNQDGFDSEDGDGNPFGVSDGGSSKSVGGGRDKHIDTNSKEESVEDAKNMAESKGIPEIHIDKDFNPIQANSEESVRKLGEEIRNVVISSAQRYEMTKGELPAAIKSIVNSYRKSRINWRSLLRNFVMKSYGGDRRWLPPARRYVSQGYYLPSRSSEKFVGVVAIDSSGSITPELIEKFFSELIGLFKTFPKYELHVIDCDAEIQNVDKYSDENPICFRNKEFTRYGCGGTDFRPVFNYVTENKLTPNCLVYFTDLYGDFPTRKPKYPVLWVTPTASMETPFGRKVVIEGE